jgi:hypothetical protein
VYAVSKPQPLDGVITIGSPSGEAAYTDDGAHIAVANMANTDGVTQSATERMSGLRIIYFSPVLIYTSR